MIFQQKRAIEDGGRRKQAICCVYASQSTVRTFLIVGCGVTSSSCCCRPNKRKKLKKRRKKFVEPQPIFVGSERPEILLCDYSLISFDYFHHKSISTMIFYILNKYNTSSPLSPLSQAK